MLELKVAGSKSGLTDQRMAGRRPGYSAADKTPGWKAAGMIPDHPADKKPGWRVAGMKPGCSAADRTLDWRVAGRKPGWRVVGKMFGIAVVVADTLRDRLKD